MSKIKCPKCGHEFEENTVDLEALHKEATKIAKDQIEAERKRIFAEFSIKTSEETKKLNESINQLKNELNKAESEKKLAINEALREKEREIDKLENTIKLNEVNAKAKLKAEVDKTEKNAQDKIDTLQRQLDIANDYKTRMNVKDLGEDLEQYCANKFNAIRTNTYPNAYFDKDNNTKINGEKGDFIFRDYTGEGESKTEFISIMFDMKNEDKDAKTKHKNEDFFKKLDSDRKAKGCEYAVLVSMLELGNDFYDQGIADVSYKYPKMFVVRPNHFLTIIALLRNAALNNAKTKLELVEYQKQNFDVTNFEKEWNTWKGDWGKNISHAKDHFTKAINDIDASIKKMQSIREELVGTINQLGYADNKVEELTLRKLAKNSPSIKEELKKNK